MNTNTGNREERGTFAKLYDVQEELSRRNTKPLGRPRKKVQRKPTTIHLTQSENRNLNQTHLLVNEQFSINRSEITGVALEALAALLDDKGLAEMEKAQIRDLEGFRQLILGFVKL